MIRIPGGDMDSMFATKLEKVKVGKSTTVSGHYLRLSTSLETISARNSISIAVAVAPLCSLFCVFISYAVSAALLDGPIEVLLIENSMNSPTSSS